MDYILVYEGDDGDDGSIKLSPGKIPELGGYRERTEAQDFSVNNGWPLGFLRNYPAKRINATVIGGRSSISIPLCARYSPSPAAMWEETMSKVALYVPLEAKAGKEKEVAEFLKSALPLVDAEPGTISWFAIQNGPSSFAIFDTFNDEAGRDAHLNGKVAAALMAKAGELLAKPPTIHKIDILARKLPK
jgi:quinol monooxygenase YgiN